MCFKSESKPESKPGFVRHYTNVGALFKILEGGLKFGTPREDWDDLNDYFTLDKYKECKNKYTECKNQKNIYVICFCECLGSVHHWYYYGSSRNQNVFEDCYKNIKCCIKLNRAKLDNLLSLHSLSLEKVEYLISNEDASSNKETTTQTVESYLDNLEKLPYIKRIEYAVEKEWRIVTLSNNEPSPLDIKDCIEGISILIDETSPLYCLIKCNIINKYPYLYNIIDNNGIHKSKRWEEEVMKVINNKFLKQ